jgi:elongator complex protein 1
LEEDLISEQEVLKMLLIRYNNSLIVILKDGGIYKLDL